MDSRSEHAEKTRPVDPPLVSYLTDYSAMRTRQAERRWITIGREDASDAFRCSDSLSHWHCPCCWLVLPLPPPNRRTNLSDRAHWKASGPGMRGRQLNNTKKPSLILSLCPKSRVTLDIVVAGTGHPAAAASLCYAASFPSRSGAFYGNQCHALPKPNVEVPVAPIKVAA